MRRDDGLTNNGNGKSMIIDSVEVVVVDQVGQSRYRPYILTVGRR